MADEKNVKVTFRGWIPTAGRAMDTAGNPVQAKQLVIARVTVTGNLTTAGILPLTPKDLGLSVIDFIKTNWVSGTGTTVSDKSFNTSMHVDYDDDGNRLFISNVEATGLRAAVTTNGITNGAIQIVAIGDSLAAPEFV